jgi:hypothetical protein
MATIGKTEKDLWSALEGLNDDLLDLHLPEAAVDEELKAMGIDPALLAKRGREFVVKAKEEERLSWQKHAQERRNQLQARASKAAGTKVAAMDRKAILGRLDELRANDSNVGTAIRMAARKRKPEESTDEELRALLDEMETLRALDGNAEE